MKWFAKGHRCVTSFSSRRKHKQRHLIEYSKLFEQTIDGAPGGSWNDCDIFRAQTAHYVVNVCASDSILRYSGVRRSARVIFLCLFGQFTAISEPYIVVDRLALTVKLLHMSPA